MSATCLVKKAGAALPTISRISFSAIRVAASRRAAIIEAAAGQRRSQHYAAYVRCNRCGQTGHMTYNCPKKNSCYRCGEPGHHTSQCTKPKTCHRCGEDGHISSECKLPPACFRCGSRDHVAAGCPQPRACHACGSTDHMIKDCPVRANPPI